MSETPAGACDFDLVVIGAGPAGISAASGAALFGKRVALVERNGLIGGAGINTGTIPSKTLRETAVALSGMRSRRLLGLDCSLRRTATARDLMRHEAQVTESERKRAMHWLHERRVELLHGAARFVDPHTVRVEAPDGSARDVRGRFVLIATGSAPVRPEEFDFEDDRIHDSNEILELTRLPTRLVVVGAGVVGSEYASVFAALGVETHLVDGRDVLLPFLDRDISSALERAMKTNGVRFHWNERVVACDSSQRDALRIRLASGEAMTCDGLLVCAGRRSNTDTLGLAAAGIAAGERGLLAVNGHYQTAVPHIYAAGDVIGAPALAATSIEQARVAACAMFSIGLRDSIAPTLPTGIYTIPEASVVGETEESVRAKGIDCVVGRCRSIDLPRGQIIGDDVGFLKLVCAKDDLRILGVHVIGEGATELVHIGMMAIAAGERAELFTRLCFNYPTSSDLYKYAAYDAILRARGLTVAAT